MAKSFGALRTAVGPVLGMSELVALKAVLGGEGFAAFVTGVLACAPVGVELGVLLELGQPGERLGTLGACVGPLPRVAAHVADEVALADEGLAAYGAGAPSLVLCGGLILAWKVTDSLNEAKEKCKTKFFTQYTSVTGSDLKEADN